MTGQEIQNTHNQHMDRYQVHDLNRRFPPLGVPLPQKHTISETELEHDQEAKSAHKKKKKLMTIKKSEADDEEGKKISKTRRLGKNPMKWDLRTPCRIGRVPTPMTKRRKRMLKRTRLSRISKKRELRIRS
jgi:hypothetical protein